MIEFSAVHTKRPRDLGPRIWDLGTPDWDLRTPGWTSYGIPLRGDKGGIWTTGALRAPQNGPHLDPIWALFGTPGPCNLEGLYYDKVDLTPPDHSDPWIWTPGPQDLDLRT